MSSELMLIALHRLNDVELTWKAADLAIDTLSLETLIPSLEEAGVSFGDSDWDVREEVKDIFAELRYLIEGNSPDVVQLNVSGVTVYLAGGQETLDGGDPTPAYSVFSKAVQFPDLLEAVGLRL